MSAAASVRGVASAVRAIALLTLLPACTKAPALDELDRFADANQRLAQATSVEECRAAASRYEELLERGGDNGAVLHALGNACFRAGSKGRAIAAWQRARLLHPRDPWLAANLVQARAGLPPQPTALTDELLFWRDDLSEREQAWALSISVALACVAFAVSRRSQRARIPARGLAWLTTFAALICAATFARTVQQTAFTRHAAIVVDPGAAPAVVRKGDADSFEPALTEPLADGVECLVVGERGDWRQIELPGGLSGWVPAQRLAIW
ncbi:MAG: hypothetical protein EXS13_04725 [Planctomycetes bacterium]|nr:hypothetical protein [Planctomycetota bacterium]